MKSRSIFKKLCVGIGAVIAALMTCTICAPSQANADEIIKTGYWYPPTIENGGYVNITSKIDVQVEYEPGASTMTVWFKELSTTFGAHDKQGGGFWDGFCLVKPNGNNPMKEPSELWPGSYSGDSGDDTSTHAYNDLKRWSDNYGGTFIYYATQRNKGDGHASGGAIDNAWQEYTYDVSMYKPGEHPILLYQGNRLFYNDSHTGTSWVKLESTLTTQTFGLDIMIQPKITATADYGGTISPAGTKAYKYNEDTPTYTITPQRGWAVADVLVDGVSVGAKTSYTFSKVTKDHTIHAKFKRLKGSIKLTKRSTEPNISVGSRYSLAGAKYGVYYDEACTQPVKYNASTNELATSGTELVLTTNASGIAESPKCLWYTNSTDGTSGVPHTIGNYYYVKEKTASTGFRIDTTVYKVTISSDSTPATITSNEVPQRGYINISKTSTVDWTTGNLQYQLNGVPYTIAPQGFTFAISQQSTSNVGLTGYVEVPLGEYKVTENATPNGYYPVDGPITVDVTTDFSYQTARFTAIPIVDTYPLHIRKYDANDWTSGVKSGQAQANYSLMDATYRVTYYDDFFTDPAHTAGTVKWTKYFVTKSQNGFAEVIPAASDLYSNGSDKSGWPLGTYIIEEVSAPDGYYADKNAPYLFQVTKTGAKSAANSVKKGSMVSGTNTNMSASNILLSTEPLTRADIGIYKIGADYTTSDYYPERRTPQANITFQIINENDYEVYALDKKQFVGKGGVAYEITTDANGYATTNGIAKAAGEKNALTLGKYRVHESVSAPGYKAASDFIINLEYAENEYTRDVENKQGTAITITKKDAGTNKVVKGAATFQILDFNKQPLTLNGKTEFTTDSATGIAVIREKLMNGTYYVKEIKAPYGYQLSSELAEFTINADTVNTFSAPKNVDFSNDPAVFSGLIRNVDAKTATLITTASSTMRIIAADDIVTSDGTIRYHKGEVVGDAANGEYNTTEGTITIPGLYPGNYKVTQTNPPAGYLLNGSDYTLTIVANGENGSVAGSVTVPNSKQSGGLTLTVIDSETKHIIPGGAIYEVVAVNKVTASDGSTLYEPGGLVATLTTNEYGYATTDTNIPMGDYIIREKSAPDGYILNPETISIKLEPNPGEDSVSINVIHPNDPQKGIARVAKRELDGEKRLITTSSAEFAFYASEDIYTKDGSLRYYAGQCVCTATTATEGEDAGYAKTIELYCGNYYVKETKAPEGYSMNPDTLAAVTVEYSGDNANGEAVATYSDLTFFDERKMGKLEISKTDEMTDGLIKNNPATFEIVADEELLNSDGTIWHAKGEVAATIDTNASGVATSEALPLGKYKVRETKAPNLYALNTTEYPVELKDGEQWASEQFVLKQLTVTDKRQQGIIRITKVSEMFPDTKLAGAKFTISAAEDIQAVTGETQYANGEPIDYVVTDGNGFAASREIPAGKYHIVETEAPAGYQLDATPTDVSIGYDADQRQAITYTDVTIKDKILTNSTIITKVDGDTGNPIPDPKTELKIVAKEDIVTPEGDVIHKKGTVIKVVTVRDDGSVVVDELPAGEYELIENVPPSGYVKNPTPIPFTVVSGENGEVKHPGYPQRSGIKLTKVDADDDNAPIIGSSATFEITATHSVVIGGEVKHRQGAVVGTMTTDPETGIAIADGLYLGRYTIREVAAPDGYRLSNETIDIVLMYDDENVDSELAPFAEVMFADHKIPAPAPEIIPDEPIPSVPDVLRPLQPAKPVVNKPVKEWKIDNGEYVPAKYMEVASLEKIKDDEVPMAPATVSDTGDAIAFGSICALIVVSGCIGILMRRRRD